MRFEILRSADAVELEYGAQRLGVRWSRNRVHYQPRVFRLDFVGFAAVPADVVGELAGVLVAEARDALVGYRPLLLRVTVGQDSDLLPHLQKLGFLFARGVYVVAFEVPDLLGAAEEESLAALRLVSLGEAAALAAEEELMAVWAEAYGRSARLDPATLGVLSAEELRALFLGDEDMDWDLSVCAFAGGELVGVCPAYRGSGDVERELGAVGVAASWLEWQSVISVAMVRSVAGRAAGRGVERVVAEVDADAPSSVYAFAELPGRVVESLVSLMYTPNWVVAPVGGS